MTETRTAYRIGDLSLEVAPQSLRNEKPTLEQLEQQGRQLKNKQDRLWLEIGNWAVTVAHYYGSNAYERLLAVCGFDNQATMIEDWAYTCRNVPAEVQMPGLLYSFHRAVAPIKDHTLQVELLEFASTMCQAHRVNDKNYTVAMFKQHINTLAGNSDEPPAPPPGNKSDQMWKLEQELHQKEIEYQEERQRRQEAQQQLELLQTTCTTQPTPPPHTTPHVANAGDLAARIRTLVSSLSVAEFLKSPEREFGRVAGELQGILRELEG